MDAKEKDPRTHAIIGAAMENHKEMGPGFLEAVYHECLEIEFQIRNIPYISKPRLKLYYKNKQLEKYYEPDFLVYSKIVVEIKAEKCLTKIDEAQIINSLKGSKKKVGLLINFGESSLKFKRFVY
jgi:GxxExxY protein